MPSQKRPLTHHQPLTAIDVPASIDVPISVDLPQGDSAAGTARPVMPPTAMSRHIDSALERRICQAVRAAAQSQDFLRGQIGVLITDDPTIHELNRRHLGHDYPTDVISFDYERGEAVIEGELVVSLCTAERFASEVGWDWRNELLLYVIHGTLHICGLEDATADQRQQMRRAEQAVLLRLGISDADGFRRGFDPQLPGEKGAVQ